MGAFSKRLHYAAPHIGAMLASVPGYFGYVAISLGYFHPLVDVAVLSFPGFDEVAEERSQ